MLIDGILEVGVDGAPATPADVVSSGISDSRRATRIPQLKTILGDPEADSYSQYMACIALTTWAVEDGYRAVIAAATEPDQVDWRGLSIDRVFSVDNTFAQLAMAVGSAVRVIGDAGPEALRLDALRALIGAADRVYFDGQLEGVVMDAAADVVDAITSVVRRGVLLLRSGEASTWDLATQLIDLTAGIAVEASAVAANLTIDLVTQAPTARVVRHAVDVVARADPSRTNDLADLLVAYGGSATTLLVAEARERRRRSP